MTEPNMAIPDLTTTRAPLVEQAALDGKLFIEQPYEHYSETNQDTWRRLYAALEPKWQKYAHPRFLQGVELLALKPDRIPRLHEVNRFLEPLSAFESKGVCGYIPAYLFFDCLRQRVFPTTVTIRDAEQLDYLPEPDIFHDLSGHVPMHTDRVFSDILVRFGEVAQLAAKKVQEIEDASQRLHTLESNIKAMARFFWFTIEFGLMRHPDEDRICAYGSGLLSSSEEIEHSIVSGDVQRYPFKLEWVVNQYFEIDHFQPLLFYVDSFQHLYDEVDRLERWVLEGRLGNVSPGEPVVNESDLASFLEA